VPEPDRTRPDRTGPAAPESAGTEPGSTEPGSTEEGSTEEGSTEEGSTEEGGTGRRELGIPELSLVVLIGVSGSGKTTFARRHFGPFEVLSSDFCRGLVADDENDQAATADAFDVLAYIAGKRLAGGRLTVVDATNVQPFARKQLVELARAHDVLPVAIVLDLPKSLCTQRNSGRADRTFGAPVVHRQHDQLRRSLRGLSREGFRKIHVLRSPAQVEAAVVVRERLLTDYRDRTGPFDVIGDVHGCRAELEALLAKLGYLVTRDASARAVDAVPPDGRAAVFLGDLVDRGPDSPGVLRLVMGMVAAGHALAVPGNHENKLIRALSGRNVQVSHGLAETLSQLAGEGEEFRKDVAQFCRGLVSHLVLDGGRLVVAHAGLKQAYQGRASGRVRSFALYGDTTGETDEFGLPVRYPWADDYRGRAMVLYGHTPTSDPEWVNNTMCLDTGCVFGGRLTALRYPEKEMVSVPAGRVWYEPARPFPPSTPSGHGASDVGGADGGASLGTAGHETGSRAGVRSAGGGGHEAGSGARGGIGMGQAAEPAAPARRDPGVLDITDVLGKRVIETAHHGRITVREENAAGALEVMSRFAVDPRWLRYLPPTMAPSPTSGRPGLLEHPAEAFAAYGAEGVTDVICEEKHMGSRAVLLACRDEDTARARFAVADGMPGAVYTRTGRPFFGPGRRTAGEQSGPGRSPAREQSGPGRSPAGEQSAPDHRPAGEQSPPATTRQLLDAVRAGIGAAGLWDELGTGWILLDCELMPWSVKTADLLRHQYAAVGAAARAALPEAVRLLGEAAARGIDVTALAGRTTARAANAGAFTAAYRHYCWPVDGLDGVRLAPFQVLATEGAVYHERDHGWHLVLADRLAHAAPELITGTRRLRVDITDPDSVIAGIAWWEELTGRGGEGMVVKPYANLTRAALTRDGRGLAQPGIKVRGREYLRIIYGPDYTEPANLARLRDRHLGRKRSLALREYALGLEALERGARGDPLWRIHEAVFGVLALESEPVDPRL
jgi:protein phosphatase